MNVEVSQRVARAMYVLRDELDLDGRSRILEACEAADSFDALPPWLLEFVERADQVDPARAKVG